MSRSNDSQMHIFLGVPCQSVSHDLVRYNGSENCSSTTGLLCSPPNLAFSLPLYFFLFPRFSFSSGCDLWPCCLAKGLSLGSVVRSTNTKCACQEKERQTSTYNRWWKNGKGCEDAGWNAIIEILQETLWMLQPGMMPDDIYSFVKLFVFPFPPCIINLIIIIIMNSYDNIAKLWMLHYLL